MQKLIKRRMRSYLHPTGMDVRGYLGDSPGYPPMPPPPTPAPADSTGNSQVNQIHRDAATIVAVDMLKGALYGAASGAAGGPNGMATGAAIGAGAKGAESIITNCVNCHQKKN